MSGSTPGSGACNPTILARIADTTAFNAWKAATDTSINSIRSTAASGSVAATPAEETTLTAAVGDIMSTTACMQEQYSAVTGATNQISTGQEAKIALQKQIEDAEGDIAIARDRVAYIKNPEKHTSYYENWFPLNRPMNESTIPFFVWITVFFMLLGLFLFMSLIGVDINITFNTGISEIFRLVAEQFTVVSIILLVIVGLSFYYITTNKSK
jgi:hypothetical protein